MYTDKHTHTFSQNSAAVAIEKATTTTIISHKQSKNEIHSNEVMVMLLLVVLMLLLLLLHMKRIDGRRKISIVRLYLSFLNDLTQYYLHFDDES